MTETKPPAPSGILSSLRTLADGFVGGVQSRLELLSLELQEEKYRLIQILCWISAGIFAGVMALTFTSLTLVFLFWETARLAVLAGLSLFYLGAFAASALALRRAWCRQPRPFAGTLAEIQHDRACIRNAS